MQLAEIKVDHFEGRALQILEQTVRALESPSSVQAGLDRALEVLEESYGAVRSAIVLCSGGGGHLRVEASRGLLPDQEQRFLRIGDGLMERIVESGKPVVIPR